MSIAANSPLSHEMIGPVVRADERFGRMVVTGFLACDFLFQIGLFFLGNTGLRLPLRMGVYGVALMGLLLISGQSKKHAATMTIRVVLATLVVGMLNPAGGILAAIAQQTLYVAVLAPMLWIPRLNVSIRTVRWVVLLLWLFHSASAYLGLLQTKYPGTFDGAISLNYDDFSLGAMSLVTADGVRILRPKGLTDVAGGAGTSGVTAIVLSIGMLILARRPLTYVVVLGSIAVSMFSILLSHGRTNLIFVIIAAAAMAIILIKRRDRAKLTKLAILVTLAVIVGTSMATALGGQMTLERWSSLMADDPGELVYSSRGRFLEKLVTKDLFDYPLGAGAGRWGMMAVYFGNPGNSLWAEMTWTAFIYDGGIPLVVTYAILLFVLLRATWRLAVMNKNAELSCWAAVSCSFTLATVAASFVYPIYVKATAMEMFVLNVCIFMAAENERVRNRQLASDRGRPYQRSVQDPVVATSSVTETASAVIRPKRV